MSLWLSYSVVKHIGDRQAAAAERRIAANKELRGTGPAALVDRVQELEAELGRMRLLAYTLVELCVKKGVCTAEEFRELAHQIDLIDGTVDGQLAPRGKRVDP